VSIWSAEEQAQLDYVEIETTRSGKPVKVRSPGVCEVDGDGIPREWDVVQGFGLSGATQRFKGIGLAEFSLTIKVWETAHRTELKAFASAVEVSQPGQPERVYAVKNPRLAFKGIDKMVFLNDPFPKDGKDQSDTLVYKCRQWRKPLPTLTAPSAAGSSSEQGKSADVFEARLAARAAVLENRFKTLTGQQSLATAGGSVTP
jgi:hypothetical protein